MSNYTDRLDRYMEAIHSIDLGMVYCYTWNIVLHENPMAPNMATRKSRLIIGKQNKIDQKNKNVPACYIFCIVQHCRYTQPWTYISV